jgi:hypothetical protein
VKPAGDAPAWTLANVAARRYHAGGVKAGSADDPVRFVGNGIDLAVRQALPGINAGEVVPGDS